MKRILKMLAVFAIFLVVLYIGGYSWSSFSKQIEIRNPDVVLAPLRDAIPSSKVDLLEGDESDFTFATDADGNIEMTQSTETLPTIEGAGDIDNPFSRNDTINPTSQIDLSYTRILSVTINGQTMDLEMTTSASFVKWLAGNYSAGAEVTYADEDGNVLTDSEITPSETTVETSNSDETIETSETTTPVPTINPVLVDEVELSYDDVLVDEAHLLALVEDIEIVDELPNYNNMIASGEWEAYNRTTFENPVCNYILGGIRLNRNNYSWYTSPWFNQDDFTYTCPYTGTVIHDLDDDREDSDFGNLDYDHIVPLKSAYIRGAWAWTNDQRNEYAYDQWVGIDVLNSANRSKSDKGPLDYLPEINIEDYCYSWLMICSKYDLVMTQEEVDLCQSYIIEAIRNGETVEHLGGYYEAT